MPRAAATRPAESRVIMVRPQGQIRAALEEAVAKDPQGRSMSDILRDAFWEWQARQAWFAPAQAQPRRRTAP